MTRCRPEDFPPYPRGQSLVEFVLILPVMMLVLLGGIEVSFLVGDKFNQDHNTATLADYAADTEDGSWPAVAIELFAPDCDVDVAGPDAYGLYVADSTCTYHGRVTPLFFDLPISAEATSASWSSAPPTPTPTPSPTPSPTPCVPVCLP